MWLPYIPPDRIHHFIHYVKRMGSENDRTRNGVLNETERYFDNHNHGLKSLKRQKSPAKSLVWADELKRQFTYTLKPSKCSNTDITKPKPGNGDSIREEPQEPASLDCDEIQTEIKTKFFTDMNLQNIFLNSEYFKLKSGNTTSLSFCNGDSGENHWTIDTKNPPKKSTIADQSREENAKTKKLIKKPEPVAQPAELKYLKNSIEAVLLELKQLKRDFGLVRMDLKNLEKFLRLQTQVPGKSKQTKKECGEMNDIKLKVGKFSQEVEKAAQELRDFIDTNRTLLDESEYVREYPDLDKIISNLHRLSETAYQPKITQTSMGAKFEAPRELPISLYADGILLRNKEFRKFTDIKAGLFLRDIEDGFFPSELWPEFPYGVPFQVTDRRFELFNYGNVENMYKFPGNGRRLGTLFDGKPSSMVYLEPEKPGGPEMGFGEPEKKRTNAFTAQDYKNQNNTRNNVTDQDKSKPLPEDIPKLMSLRVRLGMGKEGVIHMNIMSNDKMSTFQDALFAKLCERYHNEYVKNLDVNSCNSNKSNDDDNNNNKYGEMVPDFEIHAYGRKPFRLSEKLNLLPSECGIVENSVINITEI